MYTLNENLDLTSFDEIVEQGYAHAVEVLGRADAAPAAAGTAD